MSQPPLITLHVSRSPLLPDLDIHLSHNPGSIISALLTKRILSVAHSRSECARAADYDSASPIETTTTLNSNSRHCSIMPPESRTAPTRSPSLTERAPSNTENRSSQAIITLLNVLDNFDADVAMQVARVKDNIREVYECVEQYKQERLQRELAQEERMKQERQETKEIGSDFWLGV